MLGEHADDHDLRPGTSVASAVVPFDVPAGLLNRATVRSFNWLYYRRTRSARSSRRIPFEPYFYPLDKVSDSEPALWANGLLQYQLAIPFAAGRDALRSILIETAESGVWVTACRAQVFGPGNEPSAIPVAATPSHWTSR